MTVHWSLCLCHDQKVGNLEASSCWLWGYTPSSTNDVSKMGVSVPALNTHETMDQSLGTLTPLSLKRNDNKFKNPNAFMVEWSEMMPLDHSGFQKHSLVHQLDGNSPASSMPKACYLRAKMHSGHWKCDLQHTTTMSLVFTKDFFFFWDVIHIP